MKPLTSYLQQKKASGKTLFIPYLMAGANGLQRLEAEIKMLAAAGADAIEIGIPFSDPVADGPVIQMAGIKSRKRGTTFKKIIQQLQKITSPVPLILMGYTNSFLAYGIEELVEDIAETEVKGLIIPDLPYEHQDMVKPKLDEADIALIQLISLTSPRKRIAQLVSEAEGFIYAVTVNGITGEDSNYQETLDGHLQEISALSSIPVLAGFGISRKEHIQRFKANCDGVVIGSFIVNALRQDGLEKTKLMINELFAAL
jgi:tryptophan synthase alpha chain